jgi:hypothetical protein
MPLHDTPWERGKCAYKLLQVMAAGKPVIASPVGANRQVVQHGVNGFLADTPSEWADACAGSPIPNCAAAWARRRARPSKRSIRPRSCAEARRHPAGCRRGDMNALIGRRA